MNVLETKFFLLYFSCRVCYKKDTLQQQCAGIKKRKLFLTDSRMRLFGSDRGQGSGEKKVIRDIS
jgi:hypothetical protein